MIIVSIVFTHGVYLHISTENSGGTRRRRLEGECFARQISLTLRTFQEDRIKIIVVGLLVKAKGADVINEFTEGGG